MAKDMDRDKLRKELIEVYSAYMKDPADAEMKRQARRLHQECGNSGKMVDRYMRLAIHLLVDIGWDLPAPPKPTREGVEQLVVALAARKA